MVDLAQRFKTQPIMVLNRGISGERAVDMLARFDKSVSAERPDLVLWQVGTNAVLRGYEHSKSILLIRDGIRRMKAIGADVVLIDPQFAPKVIAKPEIEDMVDLISSAAAHENVDVFHRFARMRHWHDIDGMPFEAFLSPDGLHMNDWSYNCFAKASRTRSPMRQRLERAATQAATPPLEKRADVAAWSQAKGDLADKIKSAGLNPVMLRHGHRALPLPDHRDQRTGLAR